MTPTNKQVNKQTQTNKQTKHTKTHTLTDGSVDSFVTPCSVICMGFFANGARHTIPSRKYPMDRAVPQSCVTLRGPLSRPGDSITDVPVGVGVWGCVGVCVCVCVCVCMCVWVGVGVWVGKRGCGWDGWAEG